MEILKGKEMILKRSETREEGELWTKLKKKNSIPQRRRQ